MVQLLYIESSPRKQRSSSIAISKTFLETYRKTHPQDQITTIDLWQRELPHFSGDIIDAKYAIMHAQSHSEAQAKAWRAVEDLIAEFKQADKYVISLPMWNFSIPYKLKHYIDLLVQPGYTFTVTPKGEYQGLVTGKKVALIYARGGAYNPKELFDLQTRYMETVLRFIGFTDFTPIIIEPTLSGTAADKKAVLDAANSRAQTIATQF